MASGKTTKQAIRARQIALLMNIWRSGMDVVWAEDLRGRMSVAKVGANLDALRRKGLLARVGNGWTLTEAGRKRAEYVDQRWPLKE